ncbi:MAG: twin-arginine translocase TatA/TatE family subunit [Phycisphaerae bacterium]|nr:twin-arginine translocase TatA/TatE family subunit [Phycisphaerae bacterium]
MPHLPLAFIGNLGWPELAALLVLALLLFGSKRLPELARSLGKSVNELKRGLAETQSTLEKSIDQADDVKSSSEDHKSDHS